MSRALFILHSFQISLGALAIVCATTVYFDFIILSLQHDDKFTVSCRPTSGEVSTDDPEQQR